MKFSIVTPTRNAFAKLQKCVGSVRGQAGVDYEHIIQDACSTDGTSLWMSSQTDIIGCAEEDSGMYDAINRGWSKASGDIYAWLNSDEQYLPGTLRAIEKIFAQYPDVDFIRGNTIIVNAEGAAIAARRGIRLSQRYIANSFLNAYSCALFFRSGLWDSGLLRFDTQYRYAGDMEMILRLLRARKQYFHMNQYLALFTFDGANLSCHPTMLEETSAIQRKYGGSSSATVRQALLICRYAETLLNGSYRKVSVTYDYAVDSAPNYRRLSAQAVPGSYKTR